uniref:Antimicrobial-peptide n=1 Tax=Alligator sinensis TaxID=38654 RepID=A0A2H4ZLD8_ALLSI|nr:antimicrobial-peptide [Alligator sinensis]
MRVLLLLFALLFLVFQAQAQHKAQEEAQDPALQDEAEAMLAAPENSPISRSNCKRSGAICRVGFCFGGEVKLGSCAFLRPCCKELPGL